MGFFLGIFGAICFAAASIMFRIGQRTRPDDDGHFLSIFVNAVVMGAVVVFVDWSPWSTSGVVALLAAGVVGSVLGRFSLLRGIRLIGPTRSNTFITAIPLVTAILGWIVLGESIRPIEGVGGVLVVIGLLRIVRMRAAPTAGDGGESTPIRSYIIAAGAPTFFGIAFVIRKWGLERLSGAITGAFIGSISALLALLVIDLLAGRTRQRLRSNFTDVPWLYVGAGVSTAAALLSQFRALELLQAWVVGALQGTQVIWTMLLSVVILGQEERITARLVANVMLVVSGVALIAIVV